MTEFLVSVPVATVGMSCFVTLFSGGYVHLPAPRKDAFLTQLQLSLSAMIMHGQVGIVTIQHMSKITRKPIT